MNTPKKKDCCKGCQHGKPGGNPSCQARRIMEALEAQKVSTKNQVSHEN